MTDSIIGSESVKTILSGAKTMLALQGSVPTHLFLQLTTGEVRFVIPHLPDTAGERLKYFTDLGFSLLKQGKQIAEAIMVSEAYVARSKKNEPLPLTPPSQSKSRQEAIILVGRNAAKSRVVFLIQPLTRGKDGKPKWGRPKAVIDEKSPTGWMMGLLDNLFVQAQVKEAA